MPHDSAGYHVDVEEEPGTYRSNWACMGAMLLGALGMANGYHVLGTYTALGSGTLAVGALVFLLNAARLFAGAGRWASQVTIALGVLSWYSAYILGVSPTIFETSVLWLCWTIILTGVGYVFMGTWAALGAPGRVEWEPFLYNTES